MAARTAPAAKGARARMKEQMLKMRENAELTDLMRTPADESKFYDKRAPTTVARAQRARDNYKTFCETFYDETDEHDMYAADKLIDRVCRFLEGMALMTQGRLQEKVKVSTLMQCRQALEWWIKEFTPTFSTFQLLFETRTTRHIHMVAVKQNLSTEFREKNNLGEFELGMFYNQIMLEEHKRIDNFKQHYTAWVLSFITGARPGSFTVSPYYRKGAPLGGAVSDSMPARAESHTLRWSDITFERMKNGIACRLTFRFLKGYQHPYRAQYVMGSREWFFPPKKTQLHLDVSLLLFLLAVERGLFKGSWEEILSGSDHIIKKNKDVDRQAVFVSADTNGALLPTKDMGYGALNPKLQDMCRSVGLFDYNNMYAFRREAAVDTKRKHGLEAAQELINHVPNNKVSFMHYDPKGFGRRDTTAFRLGGPELSADDIHKYFSQSARAWKPLANAKSAKDEIKAQVEDRLLDNEEWSGLEEKLEAILLECHKALQTHGSIPADEDYGFTVRNVNKYTTYLNEDDVKAKPDIAELAVKLKDHYAHRKMKRRDIRHALTLDVVKILKDATTDNQQMIDLDKFGVDVAAPEDIEDGEDDDAYTAATAGRTEEPSAWKNIGEGLIMVPADDDDYADDDDHDDDNGDDGSVVKDTRLAFIKAWLRKTDSEVKSSGLQCFRCQADCTQTQEAKEKKWKLGKLNTHLKSQEHSRREQLRRAFKIMIKDAAKVKCPLCPGKSFTRSKGFMAHIDTKHADQLGLEEEADNIEDAEQAVQDDEGQEGAREEDPDDDILLRDDYPVD